MTAGERLAGRAALVTGAASGIGLAVARRFLTEGLLDGAAPGAVLPGERLRVMIAAYYAARGWDERGFVPGTVVHELTLDDLAGEANSQGRIVR